MKKSNYFKWLLAITAMLQFNFAFAQSTNCETTVTPSVSIDNYPRVVCRGNFMNFVATPINGGATPLYQWYVNEVAMGALTTSNTFTFPTRNNDLVYVVLKSSLPCVSSENVFSNRQEVLTYESVSPGKIGFDTTICSNVIPNPIKDLVTLSFTPFIFYAWENSLDGITWTRIEEAQDKTLTFKEPLKKTTLFRRVILSIDTPVPPCPIVSTNIVEIKVIDGPECQPTHTNDQTIEATKTVLGIYNIQGMEVDKNYKGLVLYKYTDGTISKVLQE